MNLKRTSLFLLLFILYTTPCVSASQYDSKVHKAQKRLTALGFQPGVIDGLWGNNTKRAVEAFQKSKGLPITGILNTETLSALYAASVEPAAKTYSWLTKPYFLSESLVNRVKVPDGYKRIPVPKHSFQDWLRMLPLKKENSAVFLYNGSKKGNQSVHHSVIDIDTGEKDLQQCADAVMRLRAEYLFSVKKFREIHFNFTSGDKASYQQWRKGYRPTISGNSVKWTQKSRADSSYSNFRSYLNTVFTYAGTYSLSKELISIKNTEMEIGDVFIKGGFPGHTVIVIDMAVHKITGHKLFMLAQSYMPAQNIHILRTPNGYGTSPWYRLDFGEQLKTPEWNFSKDQLKRFK